jgi:hypothetical protein
LKGNDSNNSNNNNNNNNTFTAKTKSKIPQRIKELDRIRAKGENGQKGILE